MHKAHFLLDPGDPLVTKALNEVAAATERNPETMRVFIEDQAERLTKECSLPADPHGLLMFAQALLSPEVVKEAKKLEGQFTPGTKHVDR